MSFSKRESSRTQGETINVFLFRYSEDSYYGYCDGENAVAFEIDGVVHTFEPAPVGRGDIVSNGTLEKTTLEITLPKMLPAALLFRDYPPSHLVTLVIFQGHAKDGEFLVAWSGSVTSSSRDGTQCKLTCEPFAIALQRVGLRKNYQYGCTHALYGPSCSASEAAASVSPLVAGISGNDLALPEDWATDKPKLKFRGGIARWTSSEGEKFVRTIIAVDPATNTVRVGGQVKGLEVGQAVTLSLGCNRQMSDCLDLHANIHNFGGCPWIPLVNPMSFRNIFG